MSAEHYPIIWVIDDDQLFSRVGGEYRARRPLKLGTDIKTAWVTSDIDRIQSEQWVHDHRLDVQVQVI